MAVLIEKEEQERCEDTKEEKEMSDPFSISQAKSCSLSPNLSIHHSPQHSISSNYVEGLFRYHIIFSSLN